ncbi:MAG: quinone-dependent dihydroorotate dehydrogenase [Candidatus Colwellbacteria bacterium]|nr:quinone-dependent dihydroorotate dehydrogenase [Candidatus Colwellbacteria bacterium]
MRRLLIAISGFVYKGIIKKILFLIDSESVHRKTVTLGHWLGKRKFINKIISSIFQVSNPILEQSIFNLKFVSPVGLAAGFDYEGRLTQILPSIGFGFGTIGTLTNLPYEGNPQPRMGRLPTSRALMVNKGFKNLGVKQTLTNLEKHKFVYPVGISIGKTNTDSHKTLNEAISDVVSAFKTAESSNTSFSYYELNISCPNLNGSIEFYEPEHLNTLLNTLGYLEISRPVFVKMPISKSNDEIKNMMSVIVKYPYIKAVILGNLQKDRSHPTLMREEVEKFPKGNFSGLPCKDRSDELIALIYKDFGERIKIIGCGGIFSAEDAYKKIKLGSSLVELITGLVFEGPQLVSEINCDLVKLIKKDGYASISEAVGTAHPTKGV